MTALAIVGFLRRHALVLAGIALVIAAVFGVRAAWSWQYERGYQQAQTEARATITGYVQAIGPLLAARDSAITRTDTSGQALADATSNYRKKRKALPPTLPPAVEEALDAADALADAGDRFRADVFTERRATELVIRVDTAAVHAYAIDNAALLKRVTVLEKRPTRRLAALLVLIAGGAGFSLGAR